MIPFRRSGTIHTRMNHRRPGRHSRQQEARTDGLRRRLSRVRRAWHLACVMLVLIGIPRPAAAQIGILGGYNRDMLQGLDVADGFSLEDDPNGFHLGIFLNVNVGLLGIRPAIIYHRIVDIDVAGPADALDFDLEIVEVPIDFRLRLPVPVVRPYLLAGPVFMFPSSPDESIDSLLETGPSRIDVGLGFEWSFGFRLWPEVRYGFGITQFMQTDFPLTGPPFSAEGDARLDTFMVRMGVSF